MLEKFEVIYANLKMHNIIDLFNSKIELIKNFLKSKLCDPVTFFKENLTCI